MPADTADAAGGVVGDPGTSWSGGAVDPVWADGCLVAAGHTDASLEELSRCIDAGLSLFTPGQRLPRLMDRHDNIIYRMRFRDRLTYTLIADGFIFRGAVPQSAGLADRRRLCVVSDAISAAGLGPGTYQRGGFVWICPDGRPAPPAASISWARQQPARCRSLADAGPGVGPGPATTTAVRQCHAAGRMLVELTNGRPPRTGDLIESLACAAG